MWPSRAASRRDGRGSQGRPAPPRPQAGRLFDHGGTVVFSVFVALWAVLLLECWKRKRATLAYRWGCFDYEDIEVGRARDRPVACQATAEPRPPSRRGHAPSLPPWPPRRP